MSKRNVTHYVVKRSPNGRFVMLACRNRAQVFRTISLAQLVTHGERVTRIEDDVTCKYCLVGLADMTTRRMQGRVADPVFYHHVDTGYE